MYEHNELSLINSELCRDVGGRASAPPTRRRDERVLRIAVGLSVCPPQGSARHQFPLRGSTILDWSVSGTGIIFFRVTGTKSPKAKWKFTRTGEDWFCFAGLWRPEATGGEAFRLLTTDPSPDVVPIHDRQTVVLERADWSAWLEQTGNEADLLKALSAGSLKVEQGSCMRCSMSGWNSCQPSWKPS